MLGIIKQRKEKMKFDFNKIPIFFLGKYYSIFLLCVLISVICFVMYVWFERGYVTIDQGLSILVVFMLNLSQIPYWKEYFKK
jgi:hypothetical protein